MRTTISRIATLLLGITLFQTANAHDYYPLAPGNEWFYRIVGLPPNDSTISSSVRVVGDTILSNGHQYFILSQVDIMGSKYVRTDSSSVFYLNPYLGQEERVFKLDGQVGDTVHIFGWGPYTIVRLSGVDTVTIFGQRLRIITFEIDGLLYARMRFCERFGPMTEWRYTDPPPPLPDWGREMVGCIIGGVHYGRTVDVVEPSLIPEVLELHQNFPNPFNPETEISYRIPSLQMISVRVFDMNGKEVRTLVSQIVPAGYHTVRWDARDNSGREVSSGVYFYELRSSSARLTRRMLLLK